MEESKKVVKAIQIIVQEEVKKQIQKIVKTGIKPIVQEEIERYFGKQKIEEIKSAARKSKPSILDESVVYDSSDFDDRDDWPTMQHNLNATIPNARPARVSMEGMGDLVGMPVGANIDINNPATKALANALNRDYSGFMKSIKKTDK